MGTYNSLIPGGIFPPQPLGISLLGNLAPPATGISFLGGIGGLAEVLPRPRWAYVEPRFRGLLANIEPTANQFEDVQTKFAGILRCLNRKFWPEGVGPGAETAIVVGSWGKGTRARPSSDMDVIFVLPWAMHARYEARAGNKQSGILREVRNALLESYPNTEIKGDGPTVVVNFSSYKVEVAPAFTTSLSARIDQHDLRLLLCDTNDGGRYKAVAPIAERNKIIIHDSAATGDLIRLIRMAKTWKNVCCVPIKSFLLEQLAIEFLGQWPNAWKGLFWHDWMICDFLAYMPTRQNGYGVLPVSGERFDFGNQWVSKAVTAHKTAGAACTFEHANLNALAGVEWQKLFGTFIPRVA